MRMIFRLSAAAVFLACTFSVAQAETVEICFDKLTVFQSQGDFGNNEEWELEFYLVKPVGELFLGKTMKRVPEKLAGEWKTDLGKCFQTNLERNHQGVTLKVAGHELDALKREDLPSGTTELHVGDDGVIRARDIERAYEVEVSIRD